MLQALAIKNDKRWRTIWLLTYLSDLLSTRSSDGNEEEIERVLRYLKASDEIARRTGTGNEHLKYVVIDGAGEKAGAVDAEKRGTEGTRK